MTARLVADRILAEVLSGESLAVALPRSLGQAAPRDRPLISELTYGTLRHWPTLAGIARQCLKKPLKSKDADVFCLTLLGLYQLREMRIPEHAAVSETVAVTRKLKKPWASGLVNGILRNYQRNAESLINGLSDWEQRGLPEWLWHTLQAQWPEQAEAIAAAAQQHPPMTLRVNQRKISREDYLARLRDAGHEAHPGAHAATAITLESPTDVDQLPGFASGLASVQDEHAQLSAELLAPRPGEHILDACAAPGGKTCHLLEACPEIHVTASDISTTRLERVSENAGRLGLDLELLAFDATAPGQTLGGRQFDAILTDVPCSAVGVLRRNPDIKVHRQAADLDTFAQQQRDILAGLWPHLRPGGRLLYVTCSVLQAENDDVLAWALDTLPGAALSPIEATGAVHTARGIQYLPSTDGGDGLFYGLLTRAPDS